MSLIDTIGRRPERLIGWLASAATATLGVALVGCAPFFRRTDSYAQQYGNPERVAQMVSPDCRNPDTLTAVARGPLADYYVRIKDSRTRREFHWNNPIRGSDGIWTTQQTYKICRDERTTFYFSVSSCDNHSRDYSIQLFVGGQKTRSIEGHMMMEPDHGCCGPQPQYDAGVAIIPAAKMGSRLDTSFIPPSRF